MEDTADDEDVVGFTADKEKEQQNAKNNDEHRHPDEDGRRLESSRQDGIKVREGSVADSVEPKVDELAQLIEANIANPGAAQCVSNPLRRSKDNDVDD